MKRLVQLCLVCLTMLLLQGCNIEIEDAGVNNVKYSSKSVMKVHFIDVGQGDATLITCGGESMLIDAGNNSKGTAVQAYLQNQGVKELKYAVGTHPDADHIGGLDVILYKFPCGQVWLPQKKSDTATFRDVLQVIKEKQYACTAPKKGDRFELGDAKIIIMSEDKEYSNTNDCSIIVKLIYGDTSFLLTGDASEEVEACLVKDDISADVYKVGHHGSDASTSKEFLGKVSPEYAVISCGEGNSYGHPRASVLNRLRADGVKVFRTDEQGSIIASSDGKTIHWSSDSSSSWISGEPRESDEDINYVINLSTKKFHLLNCKSVEEMNVDNKCETEEDYQELIKKGYWPCKRCLGRME